MQVGPITVCAPTNVSTHFITCGSVDEKAENHCAHRPVTKVSAPEGVDWCDVARRSESQLSHRLEHTFSGACFRLIRLGFRKILTLRHWYLAIGTVSTTPPVVPKLPDCKLDHWEKHND